MPQVDLVDETFVVASPAAVSAAVHERALWQEWWPDLELTVFQDRGEEGLRWTVTGGLVGTCELWLQPWSDGVIVHYYLRADPTRRGSATEVAHVAPRHAVREVRRRAGQVKAGVNSLKDRLEAGRAPGEAPAAVSPRSRDAT